MSRLLYLVVLLLAACSGGGGGGGGNDSAPPPAEAVSDSASVDEESSVTIDVLGNDVDVDSATLALGSSPANGTIGLAGGRIEYTPDPDFSGSDSFTYQVQSTDGNTLTGTVNVTVNDINDAPVAAADAFEVVQNTPADLAVLDNDTDVENELTTIEVASAPQHGDLNVSGADVTYTPDQDYTGDDSFSYQAVDTDGATSNSVSVAITVNPITETTLAVSRLSIPTSGYTQQNNAELGATVLTSPQRLLEVPPNTVSFALQLAGPDVELNPHEPSFFLSGMEGPDGNPLNPFQSHANFCDSGLCSTLLPRRPDTAIARGDWPYFMATFEDTLNDIDLQATGLHAAIRTGPAPDPNADFPASITVRPFMTADSITEAELDNVLAEFVQIANNNSIAIGLEPITIVAGEEFNEVSKDFNDPTTAELVRMGDAGKVNIFFVESFTGSTGGGLLGISGGLPGPLGVANNFNGVLINATATRGGPDNYYYRTTAEFAFHETGHFLGLYHTTEQDFAFNDVIDDTPNCRPEDDTNGNGQADIEECPDGLNPVFWDNDLDPNTAELLTDDQKQVIFYSPIARP